MSQKPDLTLLTINTMVHEADNIDRLKLPNKFKEVTKEFLTMLFNYTKLVPPQEWKNLFSDEDKPYSIGWLISQTPEFIKVYKSMEKSYSRHQTIKSYNLFMRRLFIPIAKAGDRSDIFAHFVCAILVKIYYTKGTHKRNKNKAIKELGEEIYNGYLVFKTSEAILNSTWSKRLTVSKELADDYQLFSAHQFTQSRTHIEQDDLSDNEDEGDDSEESQIETFNQPSQKQFLKNSAVMNEAQSLEERIIAREDAYHKYLIEKKRLIQDIHELEQKEQKTLSEIEVLKKTHLHNNQNSYVGASFRSIIDEEESYIEKFNQIAGFVQNVLEKTPQGHDFLEWANENVEIKNYPENVFTKFDGVFQYSEPKRNINVAATATPDQTKENPVDGWEEEDNGVDRDSESLENDSSTEQSQPDPGSYLNIIIDENESSANITENSLGKGVEKVSCQPAGQNTGKTQINVTVGEPPNIFSSMRNDLFDSAITAPPIAKKPRLNKDKITN